MFSLLPPNPVANVKITELFFFNDVTASLNLEWISVLISWPVFLILGVKKRYWALEIATSIGSIANNGSSSFNEETFGYVLAISALRDIAEGVDSSIIDTSAPFMAIWDAIA